MVLDVRWAHQQTIQQKFLGEDYFMQFELTTLNSQSGRQLVLAPHADDEVFGVGGVMALHSRLNNPVTVAVLTDGAARVDAAQVDQKIATRQIESRRAGLLLGVQDHRFLKFPDRGLVGKPELVNEVLALLHQLDPNVVYCTSPWEVHPDHRALAQTCLCLWVEDWHQGLIKYGAGRKPNWDIWFYEVGAGLWPNVLVDISGVADLKAQAMACFQSELAFQRYDHTVQALNRFRAYPTAGRATEVEAFYSLKALLARDWLTKRLNALIQSKAWNQDDLYGLLCRAMLSQSGELGLRISQHI